MGHDPNKYPRNKTKARKSPAKVTQRGAFTIDDVDTDELAKFVSKAHARGAAVMFTQNRERTVFGVRLYHDECDNTTTWINGIEDFRNLEAFLDELVDDATS